MKKELLTWRILVMLSVSAILTMLYVYWMRSMYSDETDFWLRVYGMSASMFGIYIMRVIASHMKNNLLKKPEVLDYAYQTQNEDK